MSEPLGLKGFVYRELLDVGSALHLDACGFHRLADSALKRIEVCTRLPEINHTPPALDWPGRMEQQATRRIGCWIDVSVHLVELPLRTRLDSGAVGSLVAHVT